MKKIIVIFIISLLTIGSSACSKAKNLELSGTIEATQIDINAEVNGKIINVLKNEGDIVHKDEIIATIDKATFEIQLNNANASLKAVQAKLDELKAGSRAEQIHQAEGAVKTAQAKLSEAKKGTRSEQITEAETLYKQAQDAADLAQKNYQYRQSNLEKIQELEKSGAVSKQQVDDAQNAFDLAASQQSNANNQVKIAATQLEQLKNGSTSETIQAAQGNYEQALAQLELLKKGSTAEAIKAAEANVQQVQTTVDSAALLLDRCSIKSPIDGIILYKSVDLGQVVTAGTIVASVQRNDDYWIKVYVPQKYNSKVNLSQKVTISTSALPGQQIDGTVIFKSPKAEFTPKNIQTNEAKEEDTVIAIKVKIDNHINELSAGMIATVHID